MRVCRTDAYGHRERHYWSYFNDCCTENAMATVDSEQEVHYDNHYDNHYDPTMNNGRKTVKETPI